MASMERAVMHDRDRRRTAVPGLMCRALVEASVEGVKLVGRPVVTVETYTAEQSMVTLTWERALRAVES